MTLRCALNCDGNHLMLFSSSCSDIHAHSTLMNGFMYGNVYDDNDRFERQAVFPKLLCNNAEDFSLVGLTWLSSFILNKILKSSYHFMIKFDNVYSSFSVRMKTTVSYHLIMEPGCGLAMAGLSTSMIHSIT